jgi:hypothetical protein
MMVDQRRSSRAMAMMPTLLLLSIPLGLRAMTPSPQPPDVLMRHTAKFWEAFRDPSTGLYCDHFSLDGPDESDGGDHPREPGDVAATAQPVCQGRQYSSAACGMGMIASCVFAEIGLAARADARRDVLQTLGSLQKHWPKEPHHGFYVHFTSAPAFTAGMLPAHPPTHVPAPVPAAYVCCAYVPS